MTELQRQVIERVDAEIAKAMRPHNLRMALYHRINLLTDDQLARLHRAIVGLSPDELDAALGYVEGLAAWGRSEQESGDASVATEDSQTAPGRRVG